MSPKHPVLVYDRLQVNGSNCQVKVRLWVSRRDQPLIHVSVDILLITKHTLDHDVSLNS